MLRVKDRFVKHFYDVETSKTTKAVALHFSQRDHNGINDMEISVLEFIKKPQRSPEADINRDRVEKRWIHVLRCPAPQGLNISSTCTNSDTYNAVAITSLQLCLQF